MTSRTLCLLALAAALGGCGAAAEPAAEPEPSATARPAGLVGRWRVERTCAGMVRSLARAGLEELAPGVVGDYFPGAKPARLARKAHLCRGAEPQRHDHFFTADGAFGSLDQDGQQVDDGSYALAGPGEFRLGSERFRYRVAGDELTMTPIIRPGAKRAALRKPLAFSPAGHQAAVAYTGGVWTRVPCDGYC